MAILGSRYLFSHSYFLPNMKSQSFLALKKRHEAATKRFAAKQTVAFQRRARWLLRQIQKEIPAVKEVVFCNGDHWLEPANSEVLFVDKTGQVTGTPGNTYPEQLRHVLEAPFMEQDLPAVSPKCLKHIGELYGLAGYTADARLHTLDPVVERAG